MTYQQCSDFDEDSTDAGWIQWFCSLDGHEFYVEVDEDYIRDNFNLYGLKPLISNYDKALDTILGREPVDEDICGRDFVEHYREVTNLYGLIHARYILSPRGLMQMKDKLGCGTFGKCPRVLCEDQYTLPVGLSDELRTHRVRVYCPSCQEVYDPHVDGRQTGAGNSSSSSSAATSSSSSTTAGGGNPNGYAEIDGAFFGSSFPHIFLQTYPSLVPLEQPHHFNPKVFGFRVHNRKSIVQLKLEKGEFGESLMPSEITKRGIIAARFSNTGCSEAMPTATGDDIEPKADGHGGVAPHVNEEEGSGRAKGGGGVAGNGGSRFCDMGGGQIQAGNSRTGNTPTADGVGGGDGAEGEMCD